MDFGNMFSGAGGTVFTVMMGVLVIAVVGIIIWVGYIWWHGKKTYVTPVRLIRLMDNGTKKETNGLRGGRVTVHGIGDFEVKVPGQMRKKRLGYIPDYSKADADGKLTFITIGDGTLWQQIEEEIITYEDIEVDGQTLRYKLLMKPIPTDIKTVTINNLTSWRMLLEKNKLTAFTIAVGAFIIMVIAHLISLYIQSKVKCSMVAPVAQAVGKFIVPLLMNLH
jgi:hypothetical protein